jgi:voltage-gated potassium channel Kch
MVGSITARPACRTNLGRAELTKHESARDVEAGRVWPRRDANVVRAGDPRCHAGDDPGADRPARRPLSRLAKRGQRRKLADMGGVRHWLDATLVVVTLPAYGRLLSSLRLVRLVRLLRLARPVVVVWRALQAERRLNSRNAFRFASIATIFLVFIAGATEATVDSGDFKSFWDGVWWAVVTVTTVGYGDIIPHSVSGRLIAMLLMVAGIGFISVLTATIASFFVKEERQDERAESQEERAETAASLKRIEADLAELKARLGPAT